MPMKRKRKARIVARLPSALIERMDLFLLKHPQIGSRERLIRIALEYYQEGGKATQQHERRIESLLKSKSPIVVRRRRT
jgi:hypothetical protein